MPFQDAEFKRHPVDDFAVQCLELNLQHDVRDVPTSVVVQFGHHEVATPLHVMRFDRDRIPRKHPIPTAQRHDEQHEEHSTGHGDTGWCDLPLQRGQQFGCFLSGFPILEFIALHRRAPLPQILSRWFRHVSSPKQHGQSAGKRRTDGVNHHDVASFNKLARE